MLLKDVLFSQGFGTRYDCAAMVASGAVEIAGEVRDDPDEERINRPDDPNNYWRYRMHLTIEELLASAEFNRSIKRMLRTSDRTDKP